MTSTRLGRPRRNSALCPGLVRALAVKAHENGLEAIRYLDTEHLKEHRKEAMRVAA